MNDFEKYKKVKQLYNLSYKGYALNRVLALIIWRLVNENYQFKIRHLAKFLFAFSLEDIKFDSTNHKILSTFGTYGRNDHKESYNYIISTLGSSVSKNILVTPQKCFHLNFKSIFCVLYRGIPILHDIKELNICRKVTLLFETIFWFNTIDILSVKNFDGVKKYLCFCDSHGLENLLTQHFNNLGIPTYSLTHGCSHIIRKGTESGMLNYENMETSHLLTWGQCTVDEFHSYGISMDRLFVGGYPKSNRLIKYKKKCDLKRCVVLLSLHYFYDLNMKLLKLLSNYSDKYEFTVKPHPASVEYYSDYVKANGMKIISSNETINNCISMDKYDWAIAVNTNAYYDVLMKGIICLRFSDGSFDITPGGDDLFENAQQMEMKINRISCISEEDYQNEISDVLKYTIGYGLNNYRSLILE